MTQQDDEAIQRINEWMASTEPNDADVSAWRNAPGTPAAKYRKLQAE